MSRSCRGSAQSPSAGIRIRRSYGKCATRPCCSCSGFRETGLWVGKGASSRRAHACHSPRGNQLRVGARAFAHLRSRYKQDQSRRRTAMTRNIRTLLLAGAAALAAVPRVAPAVTPDRLANPDKEPQNWLMNHRSYDAQRYSPLDKIDKANVKNLKLAYAVAIGGTSANENLQSTPLVEDGYMYIVDQWGIVYKIDVRSGDMGRIVWRMDPGQEKVPLSNRGAALWGNLVITVASYPARVIATNKDDGKVRSEERRVGKEG